MKNRLISFLISAALLISVSAPILGFYDTSRHWAESEIERWSELGLIQGSDGLFRPDDPITRGEMAVIADRLMRYRAAAQNSFHDLDQSWYTEAVLKTNAAGVMQGDGYNMRPRDFISRQEAAVMLCRALGIAESYGTTPFADDAIIASWSKPYVKALGEHGFISGVGDNRFAPTDNITRASVIKLLDNAVSDIYDSPGMYSKDADGSVIINAAGVTVSNMTIRGDLIISEGVADGSIAIQDVTVSGSVIIRGGGSRTITIDDSYINNLEVSRKDGTPRILTGGSTNITTTVVNEAAILEELADMSGDGFRRVTIQSADSSAIRVDMTGDFDNIVQNTDNADIRITGTALDLELNADSRFNGNFTYRTLYITSGNGCTINGESFSSTGSFGGTPNLTGLSISLPADESYAKVGGVLTASTVTSGNPTVTYQWFRADSDLLLSDSAWSKIDDATAKIYALTSDAVGKYLKVEASDGRVTFRAGLRDYVRAEADSSFNATVENYTDESSARGEISLRFVFSKPISSPLSSDIRDYEELENGYDFNAFGDTQFSVGVNNDAVSADDSMIESALYSRADHSILVTLRGDASVPSNRVTVTLNSPLYDTSGHLMRSSGIPTAVRVAHSSSWQDADNMDTSPPAVTYHEFVSAASVTLLLTFSEPLGYYADDICQPMPNNYDFQTADGISELFSLTINDNAQSDDSVVADALYYAADNTITLTLLGVSPDDAVTLTPTQPFYDLYGNALSPLDAGVFYRA